MTSEMVALSRWLSPTTLARVVAKPDSSTSLPLGDHCSIQMPPVCEAARVVLFSVTEGEDKPEKYPHMFRGADLILLTKVDLLPHLDFDVEQSLQALRTVNPTAPVLHVSARTGEGMDAWFDWIRARKAELGAAPSNAHSVEST